MGGKQAASVINSISLEVAIRILVPVQLGWSREDESEVGGKVKGVKHKDEPVAMASE